MCLIWTIPTLSFTNQILVFAATQVYQEVKIWTN